MNSDDMKRYDSYARVLRDNVVSTSDSFQSARDEARLAEKDGIRASARRRELLESLQKSSERVKFGGRKAEEVLEERIRIIRDGSASEIEDETRTIQRELQHHKHKGELSAKAEELSGSFDETLKLFLEKKRLLEQFEKTLDSLPTQSFDSKEETHASIRTEESVCVSRDSIVHLAGSVRNDLIRLLDELTQKLRALDTRIHKDIYDEVSTRGFFYACVEALDEKVRQTIISRARAACSNARIEKRRAVYQALIEGLVKQYPKVARRYHIVARHQARGLFKQGQIIEAATELYSAIRLWRDDPQTYRLLARILTVSGDYERAFAALRQLLRLCPDDLRLRHRIAAEWVERDRKPEAIAEYREIVSRDPGDWTSRRELGRLLFDSHAHAEVPKVLNDYLRLYPYDAECHLWVGAAYVLLELWKQAVPHLKTAIQIAADKWKPSLFLSIAYRRLEYYDEAQRIVAECFNYPSIRESAYMVYGDILQERGRYDDAIKTYKKALQFRSDSISVWLALANVQCIQDLYKDAAESYERASRIDANCIDAFLGWGMCLRKCGECQEAESVLTKALKLNPTSAEVRQELSVVYMETGQWEQATQVLQILPGNAER